MMGLGTKLHFGFTVCIAVFMFADYETWDAGNLDLSEAKTDEMLAQEYAREALKNGLMLCAARSQPLQV